MRGWWIFRLGGGRLLRLWGGEEVGGKLFGLEESVGMESGRL